MSSQGKKPDESTDNRAKSVSYQYCCFNPGSPNDDLDNQRSQNDMTNQANHWEDDEPEPLDEYSVEQADEYHTGRSKNCRPTAAVGGLLGGTGSITKK